MDNNPLVSVLMSVYNGERFLREALDSILHQTLNDFEFIIIDDGSTDGTEQTLDEYTDPRIVRINNEENIGLAASLNKGIEVARGEYIARMDADDVAIPHRLEKQADYLQDHPEVGVLGSQMVMIDAQGQEIDVYQVPQTHGAILWRLFFGNPMAHPTVMLRWNLLGDDARYDASLQASQDKDLWARLIRETQFANLEERLMRYRVHKGSVWGKYPGVAHEISLQTGHALASEYLEEDISQVTWDLLDRSQNTKTVLNSWEREQAAAIIHRLYAAFVSKEKLPQADLDEIHVDMIQRILAVGKRDGRIPPDRLAHRYWHTVLPKPLWKLIHAARRPERKITGLIKNKKTSKPGTSTTIKSFARIEQPEDNVAAKYGQKPEGISIVIVSYDRLGALKILLKNLAKQDLEGIETEIIIVNNSPSVRITPSRFSTLGRLLSKFHEPKILNSLYNWGPGIRYTISTAAQYRTILFFDDDIHPIYPGFIAEMYGTFKTLRDIDILTCWADLWVEWTDEYLSTVSMGFTSPEITELTECDYCGTGISMLNKRTLLHPEMLDIPQEYKFADTAWFPWIPSIVHGTRKFYFPSYGMLRLHEEQMKSSISRQDGYENFIFKARKAMLEKGYRPVLDRLPQQRWVEDSPEQIAVKKLPVLTRPW